MNNLDFIRAVALLETQDGAKSIKGPNGEDSNNLFNIKDLSGKGFRALDKAEGSRDAYRVYGSRQDSINDFVGLLERRYPSAFTALTQGGTIDEFAKAMKAGGYATDPRYVEKVVGTYNRIKGSTEPTAAPAPAPDSPQPFSPEVVQSTRQMVLGELTGGTPSNTIVGRLAAGPVAPMIKALRDQGTSDDEIVSQILGPDADKVRTVRDLNPVVKTATATGNRLSDMGLAARQIVASGADEEALRAEAARRAQDPERMALSNTTAGQIGSMLPDIGLATAATMAAPFTGGTSLLVGGAAGGAASGALEPTREDGERTRNTIVGGLLGAGTAAAPAGVAKLLGKAVPRRAAALAEREALAQRLSAEGLPVNAATLTDGGRKVTEILSDSGAVRAFRDKADDVLAGKVAEGLGVKGYAGAIDTELLNTARPAIKTALDDATNLSLTIPQTLKTDVQGLLAGSKNPLTAGVADMPVVQQAARNIIKAADDGAPVSGRQLQELMSELKAVASSQSASATERQAAGSLVGKLNDTLKASMSPEQQVKFVEANRQWANLKAAEKMVSLSNDTGVVTPRQMIQAVKTGRFKNAFLKDEAPFQELASTAAEALSPANGRGLAEILGRTVRTGDSALGAAAVLEPLSGGTAFVGKKLLEKALAKAVTSENPTIVKLLTGVGVRKSAANPVMKAYIARALAGAGAGAGTSVIGAQ